MNSLSRLMFSGLLIALLCSVGCGKYVDPSADLAPGGPAYESLPDTPTDGSPAGDPLSISQF